MNDELRAFLSSREEPPLDLSRKVLAYVHLAFYPGKFLMKFYLANFLGGLLTLFFCPQYGVGPYGGFEGLFHFVMSFGPVICGLFCAGFYFLGANGLSLMISDKIEREWVRRHRYAIMTPWISFLFFLGMLIQHLSPLTLHAHHSSIFYASWLVGAFIVSFYSLRAWPLTGAR